jgi:hypothetical protein
MQRLAFEAGLKCLQGKPDAMSRKQERQEGYTYRECHMYVVL